MAIQYHPAVGQVLYCDYSGLLYGEMSKRRLVVVVSPKYSQTQDTCVVVPLSITAPPQIRDFHCVLERDPHPKGKPSAKVWAKCDHIMTVSFLRLTGWWTGRAGGDRQYVKLTVTDNDLKAIRKCILCTFGLGGLTLP